VECKCFCLRKSEHRFGTGEDIGHSGGCNGGDEERQDGRHSEVEHKHFDDEDETSNRRFEDTCYCTCGAATYEEHKCFLFESEQTSEITADGGTGEDYGRFCTNGATAADSNAASEHRRPHIMWFDTAFTLRDSEKNFRNAMADVVSQDVLYEQSGEQDTRYRIDEEEIVSAFFEVGSQEVLDEMDGVFEHNSGNSGGESDEETDNQDERTFGDMLFSPE